MFQGFLIPFQANARQMARRELFRAQRQLVSHGCQAEYHAAMAVMLRERCQRLRDVVDGEDVDARTMHEELRRVAS